MKDVDTVDTAGISSVRLSRVLSSGPAGCPKERTLESATGAVILTELCKKTTREYFPTAPFEARKKSSFPGGRFCARGRGTLAHSTLESRALENERFYLVILGHTEGAA